MSITTIILDQTKESKDWVSQLEVGASKLDTNFIFQRFKVKKTNLSNKKMRVSILMKLNLPHFYAIFLVYALLPYLMDWHIITYLPVLGASLGFFWSPYFPKIMVRLGLHKKNYSGEIQQVKNNDLLEEVYFGTN